MYSRTIYAIITTFDLFHYRLLAKLAMNNVPWVTSMSQSKTYGEAVWLNAHSDLVYGSSPNILAVL